MANEEVKEVIEEAGKRGRKPSGAENVQRDQDIEGLRLQVQSLIEQNKMLMQALANSNMPASQTNNLSNEVKIVHLISRAEGLSTYMKLSNLEVNLTKFGEERYLTLQQFEEMVGKFRKWFDNGIISLAAGYDDLARRYALKTADSYPMTSDFVQSLGTKKMDEIEMIYNKLPSAGKEFIIDYWKRKIIEGDLNFKNINKVTMLNNISNGAMESVIVDMKRK